MIEKFTPGTYWTRTLADAAIARMSTEMASPPMQALMKAIAQMGSVGGDPAAAAADLAPVAGVPSTSASPARGPIELDACIIRRATVQDVPALAQLIVHGELPPLFIEPFVEGFCVVEHAGELVGCGGLELYGPECAVIRSVVTHASARGLGLGARIARLLLDDARAYGARDIYLFTMHAVDFWLHIGFRHLALSEWRPETHPNWQYIFCTTFPEAVQDVRAMWMPA